MGLTSLVFMGMVLLFLLNWILFLTNIYAIISPNISDIIFTPNWFMVSVIECIAAFREFKNNQVLAILILGLSAGSLIIELLLLLIGNM